MAALCSCLPLRLKRRAGGSVLLLPLCPALKRAGEDACAAGCRSLLLPSFSAALPPPIPARVALLCLLFGLFACLLCCPKEGGPPVPALPPVWLSSCLCLPPRLSVLPLPSPLLFASSAAFCVPFCAFAAPVSCPTGRRAGGSYRLPPVPCALRYAFACAAAFL